MSIIFRYLKPLFEFWGRSNRSNFGLIGCTKQVLLPLGNWFEVFPTLSIEQTVVFFIDCTLNCAIWCDDVEWFSRRLPILPFNHDNVSGSLPVRMIGC